MNDAREAILGRLTQAAPQPARPGPHAMLPGLARLADADATSLDRFSDALERVGVTWELADSPVSARLQLVIALQAGDVKRVLTWNGAHLPSPGLLDTLNILDIETLIPDLQAVPPRLRPLDPDHRGDLLRTLGAVDVGIVGAAAGFADTGTLAVGGGAGRPLLSAFLPRRLIVLLPVGRIFPSVAHWLAADDLVKRSAMLTFVTGPSQSLDLELIRAAGIHGPRQVHVVLVGEAS